MKQLILAAVIVLVPCSTSAQTVNQQTRLVFHTTADLGHGWFATNWAIGNVKHEAPDNLNLFPGVGYRGSNWWVEAMIQRQWAKPGNSWALDFRYSANLGHRASFYVESAPLLTHTGEYEFIFVDIRTWKRLSLGLETENVHRPGHDSIGAGPRISLPVASFGQYKLALGTTYQLRRQEPDALRLYVVINRRFKH